MSTRASSSARHAPARPRRDATDRLDELLAEGERVVWAGEVSRPVGVFVRHLWRETGLFGVIRLLLSIVAVGLIGVYFLLARRLPELSWLGMLGLLGALLAVFGTLYVALDAWLAIRSRRYIVTGARLLVLAPDGIGGDHDLRDEASLAGKPFAVEARAVVIDGRWRVEEPSDRAGLLEALRAAGAVAADGEPS